jgi:neopullulanase
MKNKRGLVLSLIVFCLWLQQAFAQSGGGAGKIPVIHKLDPPNWWTGLTRDLTLLVAGENLKGARVESATAGVSVLDSNSSANGHYLFIHLQLGSDLKPGDVALHVSSSAGPASINLPFFPRANSNGRFQGFSQDDVIYLIMPDRFADGDTANDRPPGSNGIYDRANPMAYHGGDLRGIHDHLPYLHDLGVTTLWLTPVWKNTDSDYHGYHVVDFYALDSHMGTMADYQALVADAHKLGMKVLIDFVANHTGPHHPWANDPPTPTWFHGSPARHLEPSYSFAGIVDPHASPRESRNTLEGWFANKLPDLNPDDPPLGVYLAQNAMWWTEIAELDGLRLDTFPYSSCSFWSGWHQRLHQVYPQITDVGEVADPDSSVTAFFEGGRTQFDGIDTGLSTVFDFPMRDALRNVIIRAESIEKIIDVLRHDQFYPHPETLVTFLGNHDDKRFLAEKGSTPAKLKAAFSLLLTLRGIPQIYAGDEIAMSGGDDPDNRRDFPGGFPGDLHNAFTAAGRSPAQQDMFAFVQSLLTLRSQHPALRTGKQWHIGWDDTYYAFLRELPEESLFVVYNNDAKARDLEVPIGDTKLENARRFEAVFPPGSAGDSTVQLSEGKIRVSVPAESIVVFKVH